MIFDILYRIDERLIHGQVIIGWARNFEVKNIFVASKEAAESQVETTLMNMATPDDIKLYIKSPADTARFLNNFDLKENKSIVLFKDFKSAYECVENLKNIPGNINVGGIYFDPKKQKILDCLYLSKEDKDYLEKLQGEKIKVIVQTLPSSDPIDINSLICG